MEILMHVSGVINDPSSNAYIVVLKSEDEKSFLPIWIGILEAGAIAMALEKVVPPRPMTHDLMKTVFDHTGVSVERIVITELKENTFYALLHLLQDGSSFQIDSRPSDALAIALRNSAPVYVDKTVLEKHATESLDAWFKNFQKDNEGYNA